MTTQQIAAVAVVALGLVQLVLAPQAARLNVKIATSQGGLVRRVFGNPATAPTISRISGAWFIAVGLYGFFAT